MLEYSMSVKLLFEQHLEFLSLKQGCTGSSVSIYVKIPHCWKSHVAVHISCCFHFKLNADRNASEGTRPTL